MESVTLTQKEQTRLQVLNSLMADHMTTEQAATLMGVSARHTRRILAAYSKEGAAALAHGNRGRRPANATPDPLATDVVVLARTRYAGVNHTHLSELLREREGTNMTAGPEGVVRFYNGRGTAEQWIKEGKYALNWTRLSCHRFVANRVRLSLFVLAYNLGNFLRRLCLPKAVKHWSLRSVQVKLIKMGGRLVRHSRWLIFQLSEVSVPRRLFQGVLDRIGRLSPAPS